MDPLPTINVVLSMVSQDEKQRELFATTTPSESPIACAVQGNIKNFKKDRPTYAHCGGSGHAKEKCYKLYGYPPGYKKPKSSKSFNQANNVHDTGTAFGDSTSDISAMTPQHCCN